MLTDPLAASVVPPLVRTVVPLQAVDPSAMVETSGAVRAAVAFPLTVLIGGIALRRYGSRIDEAASTSGLVVSSLYGFLAFGFVTFAAAFGLSELSRLGLGVSVVSAAVLLAVVVGVLSLGAFGFGVVGVLVADIVGARNPMFGVVGAAAVSALTWLAFPFSVGALVWITIAAVGLGGPTRKWVHEDAVKDERRQGGQD